LNDEDILNLDDHLPRKLKNYGIKVYWICQSTK
jgi:hypothetical protein